MKDIGGKTMTFRLLVCYAYRPLSEIGFTDVSCLVLKTQGQAFLRKGILNFLKPTTSPLPSSSHPTPPNPLFSFPLLCLSLSSPSLLSSALPSRLPRVVFFFFQEIYLFFNLCGVILGCKESWCVTNATPNSYSIWWRNLKLTVWYTCGKNGWPVLYMGGVTGKIPRAFHGRKRKH